MGHVRRVGLCRRAGQAESGFCDGGRCAQRPRQFAAAILVLGDVVDEVAEDRFAKLADHAVEHIFHHQVDERLLVERRGVDEAHADFAPAEDVLVIQPAHGGHDGGIGNFAVFPLAADL